MAHISTRGTIHEHPTQPPPSLKNVKRHKSGIFLSNILYQIMLMLDWSQWGKYGFHIVYNTV